MPFAVKDVLAHKRNDRQIREIHERQYLTYVNNLRLQQQQQQQPSNSHVPHPYYLSTNHIDEVERARTRSALAKQSEWTRIQQENSVLQHRFTKAGQRSLVDDRNRAYENNLDAFSSKRFQQRLNQYKRIDNENQQLLHSITTVRGRLVNKQQCDLDWQKHVHMMKKNVRLS